MDTTYYLEQFQNAADQLDKTFLASKQLEVAVVLYGDSVCLKLYKKSWATTGQDPITAQTRIFFSIWTNELAWQEQKLLYNIHAFKLRNLKGYSIESRKFADNFRHQFKDLEHKWPNVSTNFGPLTLMQGWIKTDLEQPGNEIICLSNNFFEIEPLIENTLAHFKR
ncbi:hypothetical protein HDF24_14705 [Mucilaginibacter sp. X4EP1]|uniref:hypothetical protein n=1 Tax=Mucilaginibacter sp. X4EP1 TaxID=2723092 RepID=UPI0021697110|nr:hypothetical protein [Mucilaginibacter sp. X4EP1]MCS3815456.1 hypothetical protein [Mucilaginibacter sp. X4EP1]